MQIDAAIAAIFGFFLSERTSLVSPVIFKNVCMCEVWLYWVVVFEKEGKNKQTIQVPLLYPAHEGIPRGMR